MCHQCVLDWGLGTGDWGGTGDDWSGVEWSGVEWNGVEWSGVEWAHTCSRKRVNDFVSSSIIPGKDFLCDEIEASISFNVNSN
jgi:hypothetical protein